MTSVPPFVARSAITPAYGPAAVDAYSAIMATGEVHYDQQVLQLDDDDLFIQDLTPYLARTSVPSVTHQSVAEVPGSCTLALTAPLAWGADRVQPALLARSPFYQEGQWFRFPLGVYVVTTPTLALPAQSPYVITGFEKTYLLQGDLADSFVAAAGTTYKAGIETLMRAAGELDVGADLGTVATFPGDWAVKTIPAGADMTFAVGSSGASTYVKVINELLKASGMRPLFNDQDGNYVIQALPNTATQPTGWTFGTKVGDGGVLVVSPTDRQIQRDVYGIPNEWVFVQQGLTFTPVNTDGSDGKYVVENTTHRPSDQLSVRRKITSTQYLNASGQADLIAQGDAIVAAVYAQAEKITFTSGPWPCAWHYDVFRYQDQNLPDTTVRKVQAQQWTLPINGDEMQWQTLVVAAA